MADPTSNRRRYERGNRIGGRGACGRGQNDQGRGRRNDPVTPHIYRLEDLRSVDPLWKLEASVFIYRILDIVYGPGIDGRINGRLVGHAADRISDDRARPRR